MKNNWNNEEVNFILENKGKLTNLEMSEILKRSPKSVKLKLSRMGYSTRVIMNTTYSCAECGNIINGTIKRKRRFCSRKCSTTYNNSQRKQPVYCVHCGKEIVNDGKIFCSKQCNIDHNVNKKDEAIERGELFSSDTMKNYLIRKFGASCMSCGWASRNEYSGRIPVELEHIDGNSENNSLSNLKLLCPNCHSLTPTYKSLNRGKGRHERMERYKKGKSY